MNETTTLFIERMIAKRVIADLLAEGHTLSVFDGRDEHEPVLATSRDADAILAAMFSTGDDLLTVDAELTGQRRGHSAGWVWFVHGNGDCVVSDYTTNLESVMGPINEWVDAGFEGVTSTRCDCEHAKHTAHPAGGCLDTATVAAVGMGERQNLCRGCYGFGTVTP